MSKQDLDPKKNDENKNNDPKQELRKRQVNFGLSYLFVALIGMWLFQQFILSPLLVRESEIPYSELKAKIQAGAITEVTLGTDRIVGTMKDPNDASKTVPFTTVAIPGGDPSLITELDKVGVKYDVSEPASPIGNLLLAYVLPLVLIGGIWYFGYRRIAKSGLGGLGGGVMGVGKSKATEVKPEDIATTYKDVGGADEAIEELKEVIQFLKEPESFARLGGRIPKGVLLVGPPGTGKTLLAKATAGEAHVPFFETSGSEFVEMFVGVGAARVRDLFEQARKAAPAVIFIDEIDAVAPSRGGANRFGVNHERARALYPSLLAIRGFLR
ncbi:ATP-dependent metallopeptidase FtsH/Yme1/Tma family protein, partial [bacterium]